MASDLPRLFIDTWAWLTLADDHDRGYATLLDLRRRFRAPKKRERR